MNGYLNYHNSYTLLHVYLRLSILYSYSKPITNFIYGNGAVWLLHIVSHAHCSVVSSGSAWIWYRIHSFIYRNCFFGLCPYMTESSLNLITMMWLAHTKVLRIGTKWNNVPIFLISSVRERQSVSEDLRATKICRFHVFSSKFSILKHSKRIKRQYELTNVIYYAYITS